ncbi:YhjD/YihY/BrkB family envelope integrity protein [Microlunatus ginsengisoli]|uniref:Inner membrane protein YhjD n=1 Tax=Microlunatus ginsengisoli TaxID=363863 RepID=A0ABP6ZBW8_9ACTN
MKEWLIRLRSRPQIAHLERTIKRFGERLGSQFAAAITYFSVLAMVPVLMFAFSILGFFLTEVRPDLIGQVVSQASNALGGVDASTRQSLVGVIENALRNYTAVGIVGLLTAAYSGAGWIGNVKKAVRAQWKTDFDDAEPKVNVAKLFAVNLGTLVVILILIAITFALAGVSAGLAGLILRALGLADVGWLGWLVRIAPVVVSIGTGWLLFMFLYWALPSNKMPWRVVRRGALIGSIGLAVLQYLTGFLIGIFTSNKAAVIFGPVIAIMLFFNLFATLILLVAAWIATAEVSEVKPAEDLTSRLRAMTQEASGTVEEQPEVPKVAQPVAVRSVRIGMGMGYVTGAATGVGIGAAIASVAGWWQRRRG